MNLQTVRVKEYSHLLVLPKEQKWAINASQTISTKICSTIVSDMLSRESGANPSSAREALPAALTAGERMGLSAVRMSGSSQEWHT